MPPPYQPVTVEPKQGGALNTQDSPEDVGAANYMVKRDWRRYFDAEIRREGDTLFQPSSGSLNNQPYPETGTPITLVHTCRRANGQVATVVGTQTTLYRYFTFNDGNVYDNSYTSCYANESGDWYVIGKNFSTNGARWEAVDVAGYTIFNNGYDLPVAYDLSKRYVVPLYELREQGIASVGTITTFNGMLLCQDITNMTAAYTTTCLTGTSSVAITATQSGTTVVAGSAFFTSAMVGQYITYATGFPARITAYTSSTHVTVDMAQNVAAALFNVAILFGPAQDPLQTSRIRYQLINSDVGNPLAFGSLSAATVVQGSPRVTLNQPMYSLNVGDNVILTGAGLDNTAIQANIVAIDYINHEYIYVDNLPVQTTQSVTLGVSLTASSGSLSYQWIFNGETLPGATASTLTISNVSIANAGNYNCVIYDGTGEVSSNVVALNVYGTLQAPIIISQPISISVAPGGLAGVNLNIATFSVGVMSQSPAGGTPITNSYQWYLNEVPIPGAVGSVFTINTVLSDMAGNYQCSVTNSIGTTQSDVATLTVPPPSTWQTVSIVSITGNITVTNGQPIIMQIGATGTPSVSYNWEKHVGGFWISQSGGNGATFTIPCAISSNAGTYRCIVSNSTGLYTSGSLTVTVNAPSTGPSFNANGQTSISNANIFAPANVTVQKSTYPGSAISSQNLQDDGSAIIRSIDLRGTLVVFKETTIFIGTFTGTPGGPIAYQKIYSGPDCLYWKWMLTEVDGTYVIYATQKDFFTFDLTLLLPRKHPQLRNASSVFYGQGLLSSQQDQCFATTNELTREVWFLSPGGPDYGLCFDYEWNTCSTLGGSYTAGATIDLPTASILNDPKRVFVMGDSGGTIRTYGLDTETGSTFQRAGVNYNSTINSGYISFADEYGEKDLRAYMPFCRGTASFTVTLYGTPDVQESLTSLFAVTINTPGYQSLIPCFYRQNYYQDQIVVSGSANPCTIVRRLFDTSKIDSRGAIKHM